MSLFIPKTQLEADLQAKEDLIISSAEAIHHAAAVLSENNRRFWSLPDDRLLAVLNHDVEQTLQTFAANTTTGTALNAQLDDLNLPQFPTRAPVEMGRVDVVFEGGAFSIVPPAALPEGVV